MYVWVCILLKLILDIALILHLPELGSGQLEMEKWTFLRFAVNGENERQTSMYETKHLDVCNKVEYQLLEMNILTNEWTLHWKTVNCK